MTIENFENFGLPAPLAACLAKMNYTAPTPIQAQAIPFALDGRDILGSAQTGTGKTAAFCIPMVAAMINDPTLSAIVLTPTRELAMQVMDVAKQMIERGTGIRTALLIGGEPMYRQFKQLNDRPRLIIGTPGRMNDHLRRNPGLFEDTRFIVLDEADRMLDMGFSVQIDTILDAAAEERQTLMFSATFAPKILKFAQTYLTNPQRVEIESAKTSADNIAHEMILVSQDAKYDRLRAELESRMGSIIVFVKTKHGADKMASRLIKDGHEATALHGGLNQRQRERATRAFREMKFRVMIATDVAARGLDIPHVEHVINYDMPMVAEDYVHRIGRTARAGAKGHALAIVSPADRGLWADVERVLHPGKKREDRSEGGEGRDFRKGPRKPFGAKGGFRQGGFKKDGNRPFKKRDDEQKSFRSERPYKQDGDRPFKKRDDDQKSFRSERPFKQGGDRPFKKRDDDQKSFRSDRPFKKDGDRPLKKRDHASRDGAPERSFFDDRPPYAEKSGRREHDGNRRFDNQGAKKPGGKFGKPKSEGRFDRADKPRGQKKFDGQKPRGDRPQGRPNGGKPGFKKRFAA